MQSINDSHVAYLPSHTTGLVVCIFGHTTVGCQIHGEAMVPMEVETNGNMMSNE
jgi:hypothetical protein